MVKAMRADGPDRGVDGRPAVRQAPAGIIRGGIAEDVDRRLGSLDGRGGCDRRNRIHRRSLLCESGGIGPEVPRTRRYRPAAVLGNCARRVPGSTGSFPSASCPARPPAGSVRSCRPYLGDRSRPPPLAASLGPWTPAVTAFHRRPLVDRCKALMPDGVMPPRTTDASVIRRPVPVAPGLLPDGCKGIIDLQPARGGSAAEWERPPAPSVGVASLAGASK